MHQAQDIGAKQPVIAPKHATSPRVNLEVNLEDLSRSLSGYGSGLTHSPTGS